MANNAPEALFVAYVAGAFGIGGVIAGSLLTMLNSYLEHRRQEKSDQKKADDQEFAILHGVFALTNFLHARLNDFDSTRNLYTLTRLSVAQTYMDSLLQRIPPDNNKLMVSLVGLGLRLESVLFVLGAHLGSGTDFEEFPLSDLEASLRELDEELVAVELVLNQELPISSVEELIEAGIVRDADVFTDTQEQK